MEQLAGTFLVEAIVWGFPNSFGVFLSAYLQDPKLSSQSHASTLLPLIGTLSSGIMYCSGPAIYPFTSRYPRHRRTLLWVGALLCWASLFVASYTSKVSALVLLQGVLYAIGGSLLYAPCMSFMSEWFVRKRGLASGIIFAGTSFGGLILPLIFPRLISRYGPSKALRILSVAFLCLILPTVPFLRPRLPQARVQGPRSRGSNKSWLKDRSFLLVIFANTLQGLAYFVPIVWLPTFAHELNLSDTDSSLALSLMNGFSFVSRLAMGALGDKFDPWLLALGTTVLTSMATFLLWGVLSRSFAGLITFGIAYGFLAGGWSSLFTSFVRPLAEDDPLLSTSLLGILMLSRGLGNVLSTPISSALSQARSGSTSTTSRPRMGFDVAGGRYEGMILYVGTCFAASGIIALLGWGLQTRRPVSSRR
ncbi:MFS general substrate transporter [Rickenella mellea]|uniref:MFS general substrate transporter n=1 Tax=Rickenella mellea TaxID=50990 RepID=A0A4Y7Q434_9AGAM|nr:MFS general substrate transporter [Rickenella mellea]